MFLRQKVCKHFQLFDLNFVFALRQETPRRAPAHIYWNIFPLSSLRRHLNANFAQRSASVPLDSLFGAPMSYRKQISLIRATKPFFSMEILTKLEYIYWWLVIPSLLGLWNTDYSDWDCHGWSPLATHVSISTVVSFVSVLPPINQRVFYLHVVNSLTSRLQVGTSILTYQYLTLMFSSTSMTHHYFFLISQLPSTSQSMHIYHYHLAPRRILLTGITAPRRTL